MPKKPLTILSLFFLVALCLSSGCRGPKETPLPPLSQPRQPLELSAWAVYWDTEGALRGLEELEGKLAGRLVSLQYFAAYFDAENRLFIPRAIGQLRDKAAAEADAAAEGGRAAVPAGADTPVRASYLTVVNDRLLPGGGSVLKDSQLLHELLDTEEKRQAHITEILALAAAGGFDGIEIDYEAIRKDMVLWQHFLSFIDRLWTAASEQGLALRVALEPGIPFEALAFPEGPEYVIMCYNLHGPGSSPGPKADDDFLLRLVQKTAGLPGRRTFALASGGFDWSARQVAALTEQQALELGTGQGAEIRRDSASQALSFSYRQENLDHQVWYADDITLEHWINLLRDQGDYGIALWRLE